MIQLISDMNKLKCSRLSVPVLFRNVIGMLLEPKPSTMTQMLYSIVCVSSLALLKLVKLFPSLQEITLLLPLLDIFFYIFMKRPHQKAGNIWK